MGLPHLEGGQNECQRRRGGWGAGEGGRGTPVAGGVGPRQVGRQCQWQGMGGGMGTWEGREAAHRRKGCRKGGLGGAGSHWHSCCGRGCCVRCVPPHPPKGSSSPTVAGSLFPTRIKVPSPPLGIGRGPVTVSAQWTPREGWVHSLGAPSKGESALFLGPADKRTPQE